MSTVLGDRSISAAQPTRRRVLWVTHLASPYRVPVWNQLVLRGWHVDVALVERELGRKGAENRAEDWLPEGGDHVHYVPLNTLLWTLGRTVFHFPLPSRTILPLRSYDVLLLGGWESPVYWWLLLRAIAARIPVVGFYESTRFSRKFTTGPVAVVQRLIFRRMSRVVVPGSAAAQATSDLGVPPHRIDIGFNAVDVTMFSERTREARTSVAPALGGHQFVYVGQLIERKRVDAIIRTIAAIPSASLKVVGSGLLEQHLRQIARDLLVEDRVSFMGPVLNRDLPSIFATTNTLVLVSREEVWGLVVNEALASGLSVVVTRRAGVAQSIEGMRGVYLIADDLHDLQERMVDASLDWAGPIENPEILRHSPAAFAEVFARAFERAIEERGAHGAGD